MAKKSTGSRNRRIGHDAERFYVTRFKEVGFDKCVTSRYGSRMHDDAKIDLINLPFNIQIKAGKQQGLNATTILGQMEEAIEEKFLKTAPEHEYPNIVIHKKNTSQSPKRNPNEELVMMNFNTFIQIINKIQWD